MQFNLADLWERVADTVPDALAVVDGERRFSYAEVDARANGLAHALAAQCVGAGDHVAIYLYNSVEYLETMIAALLATACYPLSCNIFDYQYHPRRACKFPGRSQSLTANKR